MQQNALQAALSITVCEQPTMNRHFRGATICRTREDTETRISDMESANAIATNCRSRTPAQNPVQSRDVLRMRLRRFAAYNSVFACDDPPQRSAIRSVRLRSRGVPVDWRLSKN
jgi:hypothetical protein